MRRVIQAGVVKLMTTSWDPTHVVCVPSVRLVIDSTHQHRTRLCSQSPRSPTGPHRVPDNSTTMQHVYIIDCIGYGWRDFKMDSINTALYSIYTLIIL